MYTLYRNGNYIAMYTVMTSYKSSKGSLALVTARRWKVRIAFADISWIQMFD